MTLDLFENLHLDESQTPRTRCAFEQQNFQEKLVEVLDILSKPKEQLELIPSDLKHPGTMDQTDIGIMSDQQLVDKLMSFSGEDHIRYESTYVRLLCTKIQDNMQA